MISEKGRKIKVEFRNYPTIEEAPTLSYLKDQAEQQKIDLEILLEREREIQYTASDRDNNIFLIQNPTVWREILVKGENHKVRPQQIHIGKLSGSRNN